MPTVTEIIKAPESLWKNSTPKDMQFFKDVPAFDIGNKTYGTGSDLRDESTENKNKTGAKFGGGYFHTYYSGDVTRWMTQMGKVQTKPVGAPSNWYQTTGGVADFTTAELNTLVDNHIMSGRTGSQYIIVDFEPSNPTTERWKWNYAHPNFKSAMFYISQRIKNNYNKVFYDWISKQYSFVFDGKNYALDGDTNAGFANNLYNTTNGVEDILKVFRAPENITSKTFGLVAQCGFGYTSMVYNAGQNANGVLPVNEWRGVENIILRSIAGLDLKSTLSPELPIIGYFWPLEDTPVGDFGRRSNIYTKFNPSSSTPAYNQNLTGKFTFVDNRALYPPNIIEDAILYFLTTPNLIHNEYWLHGGSYNPYATFNYAEVRNGNRSCLGGICDDQGRNCRITGNYDGNENIPCPNGLDNYIMTENRTLTAFLKAHYRYGASALKRVCNDNNHVIENYPFKYKRNTTDHSALSTFNNAVFENHRGGAALAWKHQQPLVKVGRNVRTNERYVQVWDLFADAFSPTAFAITINNIVYTGVTEGNRLFTFVIGSDGQVIIDPTTPPPATTTCRRGPTLQAINSVNNATLNFKFDGDSVFSIKWQIRAVSDASIKANGVVSPQSADVSITYPVLANGNYILEIQGDSCVSTVSTINFSIGSTPSPTSKDRLFILNLSGNGFDKGAPQRSYISDDKIPLLRDAFVNGQNTDAFDGVRIALSVGALNPAVNVYDNFKLKEAINYILALRPSRKILIDILFVPILESGDSRIPDEELSVDNNGDKQDCTYGLNKVPSLSSDSMKNLLTNFYASVIPYLNLNFPDTVRVLEFAVGQSEEHSMPYTANNRVINAVGPNNPNRCNSYSGIGDYSQASKRKWREFLVNRYGDVNLPYQINGITYKASLAEIPNVGVTNGNNNGMNYTQEAYRDLFRFYSFSIFNYWKHFHDNVKAFSGFKTGYVVADLLNPQGTKWVFHGGTIYLAMKFADQFYHTHNISPSQWHANLWGVDIQLGTFPNQGKIPAIEYDNIDVGADNGGNVNQEHLRKSMLAFFKNGGLVVHFALGWTANQMEQLKSTIMQVKAIVNAPNYTPNSRENIPTVVVNTANLFDNSAIYDQAWKSIGGTHVTYGTAAYDAIPMNIIIQNDGTVDNFFL